MKSVTDLAIELVQELAKISSVSLAELDKFKALIHQLLSVDFTPRRHSFKSWNQCQGRSFC